MSYVDMNSNARWTEDDHTARTEAWFAARVPFPRQMIMMRRLIGHLAPAPLKRTMTAEQLAEAVTFVGLLDQAEQMGKDGRSDARKLDAALDIEEAAARLAAVPPPPAEGDDVHASERASAAAAYAALLGAASSAVKTLLAQRSTWRAAQSPLTTEEEP